MSPQRSRLRTSVAPCEPESLPASILKGSVRDAPGATKCTSQAGRAVSNWG